MLSQLQLLVSSCLNKMNLNLKIKLQNETEVSSV